MPTHCFTKGLEPYQDNAEFPWNTDRVLHLYRRFGYGIPIWKARDLVSQDPQTVISNLIDSGVNSPDIPETPWINYTQPYYDQNPDKLAEHLQDWGKITIADMLNHPVRAKMSLFWSNHFVTELQSYECPSYLYHYYQIFNKNGLGDFKKMVFDIGESGAMIVYLNSYQNRIGSPNENYARELLELFTLGVDNNYSQQDITEAARALTGYQQIDEYCSPITFTSLTHDAGEKTIFGKTAHYGHQDLIDLIFAERHDEVAKFICGKIFLHFVGDEAPEDVLEELKQVFIDNDFSIEPVLRTIAESAIFFEAASLFSRIKSPYEMVLTFLNELDKTVTEENLLTGIYYICDSMGQSLFNPPSVEGWPGDKTWIDTSRITDRWDSLNSAIYMFFTDSPDLFTNFAKSMIPATTDPYYFTVTMCNALIPGGLLEEADYQEALSVFKGQIPENYFEDNLWNLEWDTIPYQVAELLSYIVQRPEYQLN